jgi:serine/threonine protein kinase/formylglycine-generating enzyme required for sulfatase activity
MTETPVDAGRLQALQKDQHERWRRGQRTWVEWYVARASWLRADRAQLVDFIYSEYCLRKELQETPSPEEYFKRFPQVAKPLQRLFETEAGSQAEAPVEAAVSGESAANEPHVQTGLLEPPPQKPQPDRGKEPPAPAPASPENTTSGIIGSETAADATQVVIRDKTLIGTPPCEESFAGQLFDRYELIEELGRGGMGVVWKARDIDLDRFVAIKLILPSHVESEVGVKRFQAEARAAARLDHPGIVTVHDFGQRDGKYFLCMAFVQGRSLAERLSQGALPPLKAAHILRDIAEAIQHAHERGVVHRDLKPPNILLTASDEPRVTDFGLARRIDVPEGITASGQVLGTPSYMSPEQASGKTSLVGPPTDIYALGAILYYALAGRPPFQGANILEIVRRVSDGKFEPLRTVCPSVPASLEAICSRCMVKDPKLRFKSAGELASALGRVLRGLESGRGAALSQAPAVAADVFLSFSHVDQSIAEAACEVLEATGLRCWMSPRDIVAGRSWDESSGRAIKESHAVLLILSSSSNRSERVLREVEHAARTNVPILNFRVQDVGLELLAPHLRKAQRIDALTEPLDLHFARLCQAVSTLIPQAKVVAPPAAAPAPVSAPGPVRPAGEIRDDNGLKLKLVWCPPGRFCMGSPTDDPSRFPNEGPVDVTLTKGFWIGKVPVTQAQWQHVMQSMPWTSQRWVRVAGSCPATWVAWKDAWEFCSRFMEAEQTAGRLPAGWKYTLPTEAQWEYACRAGTTTRYYFGDDEDKLPQNAWFDLNAFDIGKRYAHLAGRKEPNPWGLFDMHGNVWEWCRDAYAKDLPGGFDPEVKSGGREGVRRGGCWNLHAAYCRSASRLQVDANAGNHDLGFRLILEQSGE